MDIIATIRYQERHVESAFGDYKHKFTEQERHVWLEGGNERVVEIKNMVAAYEFRPSKNDDPKIKQQGKYRINSVTLLGF